MGVIRSNLPTTKARNNTVAAGRDRLPGRVLPLPPPSLTVMIDQAAGQADPTNQDPVNFTVMFSRPVTGFTPGDLGFSGTTVEFGAITRVITGGPAIYNVAIGGMTTPGDIVVQVAANAAQDEFGNWNEASTSTDNAIAFTGGGTPPVTGGVLLLETGEVLVLETGEPLLTE